MNNKNRQIIKNKFGGKCAYCGKDLEKFHIDHVKPLLRKGPKESSRRGRNVEENMYPSCPRCNLWKKVFTIEEFREEIQKQTARLNKYSSNYRLALDYNLINETSNKVVFWFEKYNEFRRK